MKACKRVEKLFKKALPLAGAFLILFGIMFEPLGSIGKDVNGMATIKASAASSDVLTQMQDWQTKIIANSGLDVDEENINKSVYNLGNQALVASVMKKAMSGKKITLVGFGGSITQGSGRNESPKSVGHNYSDSLCYVDLVGNWFKDMFSSYGAEVEMVNAGIGSTDTVLGIHRLNADVLKYNPDLVILEWDMNDDKSTEKQATYENIIRKLLEKNIAVVMLGMCGKNINVSSQAMHEPLAKHYNLPYISYKDAYCDEADWLEKLTNDGTHPNTVGHHLAALLVNSYFTNLYKKIDSVATTGYKMPDASYNADATLYGEGYIATFDDIKAGSVKGIKMLTSGSFVKKSEGRKHGPRYLNSYVAEYAKVYEPMVLEITDLNTLFFWTKKSYGIADGGFKITIDGQEITDKTFNSAGASYNKANINNTYVWASGRAFYSSAKKSIKLEIYPTNKLKEEYVGLYGLLLTGNFEYISNSSQLGSLIGADNDAADSNNNNSNSNTGNGNNANNNGGTAANTNGTGKPTSGSASKPDSNESKAENTENSDDEIIIETEEVVEKDEGFFAKNKTLLTVLLIVGAVIALGGLGFVVYLIVRK